MFTNDGIVVVIHGYTGTNIIQLVGNYEGNFLKHRKEWD